MCLYAYAILKTMPVLFKENRTQLAKAFLQTKLSVNTSHWVKNALISISQKETFPLPTNESEFTRWHWKMTTLAELRAANLDDLITGEDDYSGHIQMQGYWRAVCSALAKMK